MRIVKPYARILTHGDPHRRIGPIEGQTCLEKIEWCARISHRAEDAQTADSWRRFIKSVVIEHGDWSVVEHVSVSVDCLTDRGITHEIVRHRLFSYTQESTRFVNYTKEKDGKPKNPACFIYPDPEISCENCLNDVPWRKGTRKIGSLGFEEWVAYHENVVCPYKFAWLEAIYNAEESYKKLIAQKLRPQEARSVFPNALASRIIITGNLRNWRHMFIMRTTQEAHPQMRQIMIPLLAEFKQTFPILFDDIEPNQKQSNNLRLPR